MNRVFSPLRNFLFPSLSIIGLDLGRSCFKIVELKKRAGRYLLLSYRINPLPFFSQDNSLPRKELARDFIKEFLSSRRIRRPLCKLAVSQGAYIFSLTVPFLPKKKLRELLSVELRKKLPSRVNADNILFDFFITDEFETEKEKVFQVTCIILDRDVLEENIKIFKETGLKVTTINVIPDALGSLIGVISPDAHYVAVLDLGVKESALNFYKRGILQFSRQIPLGQEQFTQGIMRIIGAEKELERAEKLKVQCGIPLDEEVFLKYTTDSGSIKASQILIGLRPLLEHFKTEISRTINYYRRLFHVLKIDFLYLIGGGAGLKNIEKFLLLNLKNLNVAKVEKLNPLKAEKMGLDPALSREELEKVAPQLSVAWGVSIDKGGRINFLPSQEKITEKLRFLDKMVNITLFLLLLSALFFSTELLQLNRVIKFKQKKIDELVSKAAEVKTCVAMREKFSQEESLVNKLVVSGPLWEGILKELSNITPREITFRSLEIKKKAGLREILLRGEVFAESIRIDLIIFQYLVTLEESPYFINIRPISTERNPNSSFKANFEISGDLVY